MKSLFLFIIFCCSCFRYFSQIDSIKVKLNKASLPNLSEHIILIVDNDEFYNVAFSDLIIEKVERAEHVLSINTIYRTLISNLEIEYGVSTLENYLKTLGITENDIKTRSNRKLYWNSNKGQFLSNGLKKHNFLCTKYQWNDFLKSFENYFNELNRFSIEITFYQKGSTQITFYSEGKNYCNVFEKTQINGNVILYNSNLGNELKNKLSDYLMNCNSRQLESNGFIGIENISDCSKENKEVIFYLLCELSK